MEKRFLSVIILLSAIVFLNNSVACPVCPENNKHTHAKPFFVDNSQTTSNNARINKIQEILEAMKSQQ